MFCLHHSDTGPGGHLVIREGDPIQYDRDHPPPPEGQKPDTAAYMQGTSTIASVNRIVVESALQKSFVVGYALILLGYLRLFTK